MSIKKLLIVYIVISILFAIFISLTINSCGKMLLKNGGLQNVVNEVWKGTTVDSLKNLD